MCAKADLKEFNALEALTIYFYGNSSKSFKKQINTFPSQAEHFHMRLIKIEQIMKKKFEL